jgi:hypothetical protein
MLKTNSFWVFSGIGGLWRTDGTLTGSSLIKEMGLFFKLCWWR